MIKGSVTVDGTTLHHLEHGACGATRSPSSPAAITYTGQGQRQPDRRDDHDARRDNVPWTGDRDKLVLLPSFSIAT